MAERKSFLLRINPELWTELEAWAQEELRSVNGQIEFLLRDAVQRRRGRALAPGGPAVGLPEGSGEPEPGEGRTDRSAGAGGAIPSVPRAL